jgi:hypothetical protein
MNTLLSPDLSFTFICMKHKTQPHGAGLCWNLEDINKPERAACKKLVFHVTPASVSSLVSYLRHILGFLLCCFPFLSKAGRNVGVVKKSQTETNAVNERITTMKPANFSTSSSPFPNKNHTIGLKKTTFSPFI